MNFKSVGGNGYGYGYGCNKRYNSGYRKERWSSPQNVGFGINGGTTQSEVVVASNAPSPTDVTFKNFDLTLNAQSENVVLVYWALVYVQEGYDANQIQVPTGTAAGDLYNPAFNVVMCGSFIADPDSEPYSKFTPVARTLKSSGISPVDLGKLDRLIFICRSPTPNANYSIAGTITYVTKAK